MNIGTNRGKEWSKGSGSLGLTTTITTPVNIAVETVEEDEDMEDKDTKDDEKEKRDNEETQDGVENRTH